jgi:hypothetical protein
VRDPCEPLAVEHRAALSRQWLPAQWRPIMKQWSVFRRAAWKIDHRWTASKLLGYSELCRGTEWEPLVKAPPGIVRLDASVAELANSAEQTRDWEDEYPFFSDWDDDYEPVRLDEDWRWSTQERKRNQAREREADVLLVHYLLPHVRLYGKLRALKLGERAYYYRLSSALDSLHWYYSDRVDRLGNVQW